MLLPAAEVLGSSLAREGGGSAFGRALADPLVRTALANSAVQGALSALLAGALGYPAGVLLGRYRFPGGNLLRAFLLVPFLLPSLVVILGFQDLFGPAGLLSGALPPLAVLGSGLPGILAVNAYFNAAIVALFTATGAESSPAGAEDAVRVLGGSPGRVFREVWGPPSWLGASVGMLLTFVFSALGFAAPLVVCGARCYTLEVQVWSFAETLGDPASAGVVALFALALLAVPAVLYLELFHRMRRRTTERTAPARRLDRRSPWTWAAVGYLGVFFGGLLGLMGTVFYRSLAPAGGVPFARGWGELFGAPLALRLGITTWGALGNTVVFASLAALVALLVSLLAAYALRARAGRSPWDGLLLVPLLISPVLLAFGLATFWRPVLGGAGGVWLLIVLSQATVAVPFTTQSLRIGLQRLGRGAGEAARMLGSAPFDAYLDVELPRLRTAITSAGLFAFAIGLGEFTATYFLVLPPFTTLPVELYRLEALRQGAAAGALGGLLVLVSLATFAALEWGGHYVDL